MSRDLPSPGTSESGGEVQGVKLLDYLDFGKSYRINESKGSSNREPRRG